ncbi:Phosphoacetylglucosamine mutase [Porphyridium purpureum]|uniref:phosphoacetylglucosamine mutase n=1 Tax=Porphyridium purpureum TaxID=35688 RepID=A0A5J4Z5P1_PORPP|nr:Phosphoacetylglucosamine mutase [Porphyridium purpureum]|eukprot:POR1366..scf295_1
MEGGVDEWMHVYGELEKQSAGIDEHHVALRYGTGGFRAPAHLLPRVVMRCAVLMALRSMQDGARVTGLMITASHNPECDNGVKMVESSGHMLDGRWEVSAEAFVACREEHACAKWVQSLIEGERIQVYRARDAAVLLGFDTRRSSPDLAFLAERAIESVGAKVVRLGLVTTPQLHFCVRRTNTSTKPWMAAPVICRSDDYVGELASSFTQLTRLSAPARGPRVQVHVDCAHGVGAVAMRALCAKLPDELAGAFVVFNHESDPHGVLNERCGADYVQKQRCFPDGAPQNCSHLASLDGDADRLVLAFKDPQNMDLCLLDGDFFVVLLAHYFSGLMKEIDLYWSATGQRRSIGIGVVQTAYSNGAAKEILMKLDFVQVAMAHTGVKYLEKEALKFDIGMYWEPNGHGTVLFSESLLASMSDAHPAMERLRLYSRLVNQAVGDGIADLLLIQVVLQDTQIGLHDWYAMYTPRPSKNLVVKVKDKNAIETCDFDRRVTRPERLQPCVDQAIAKYPNGRAFVRPSGTEDVVRVYAEAHSWESANSLAEEIAAHVGAWC